MTGIHRSDQMGHEVILTVRTGITGILAKPNSFKPVLHLYQMINVLSGSILPFSKIKAKFSTVNHHNSHKFPQFPTNFSCCGEKKLKLQASAPL